MTVNNTAAATASGIVVRADKGLGLVAYSPFTGLVYAIPDRDSADVLSWLSGGGSPPNTAYATSLGAGWAVPVSESCQPERQLLPSPTDWDSIPAAADRPLVINWLITGGCQMACKYCYAEDLMRGRVAEPSLAQLEAIAERILSYGPVAVVLTGGDPLTSRHLLALIERLSGRVGLMVDTNGLGLTDALVEAFATHRVVVRVSLDSERPTENEKFRQVRFPSGSRRVSPTQTAVDAAVRLLDANVTTAVQTVATKYSTSDLVSLGDKLYRMGVRSWRVHRVASSAENEAGYTAAKIGDKAFGHGVALVQRALRCDWGSDFAIQFAGNEQRNSVILVGPDGRFFTERQPVVDAKPRRAAKPSKMVIDPKYPLRPRLTLIRHEVNMWAHASRYLNLSTNR